MRRLLASGLFVLACDSDPTPPAGTDGTGGPGSSTNTTEPATSGGTAAGTTTGAPNPTTTSGDATSGPATGSTGYDGPRVPGDCKSLLAAEPDTPSGVHAVRVGGNPNADTFGVYCDMVTDGGGWTLVGRSVSGDWDMNFGWFYATGSVEDDSEPYSLGVGEARIDFTELLWGNYTEGKTWSEDLFTASVPQDWVWLYTDAPYSISPTTIAGTCSPDGGPLALRVIGFTERTTSFMFSDSAFDQGRGLERARWDAQVDDCDTGGNIHDTGGMVFVR